MTTLPVRHLRRGRLSLRIRPRAVAVGLLLLAAALAVGAVAIGTGTAITVQDVLLTLAGKGTPQSAYVVYELRAPRVLVALLVGAALGTSGAIFQGLSRNPLGSPDVIGFNQGAATGAVVVLLVLRSGSDTVSVGAMVFGMATALVVYLLAYKGGVQGYRLVLVGIGVSAMLEAVTAYLLVRADLYESQAAKTWLIGSLSGSEWGHVGPLALAVAVLLPAAFLLARPLGLLELGDDTANGLGLPVERTRLALVAVAVALSGVSVASAGPILFVALAAPQLAKRLTRAPGPGVVPAAFMGALLLVTADFAAQRLPTPGQLPVGVLTGSLGGLYLGWLMAREWRARARA
ncbi:FecCD family ABC transporter permease [Bailinhaonella thermotolerans]|uniref:Iron complex transport system permease protein n=1 Tax=Bailinhaonella thermotolerans TaxID=1070861 RepID=A0A3A4B147_9ACTN|nr:iron chelate uptake ABC transporter family permease subunit [Bailinhaonella thermotolerans]RJL34559.1 hypothetical protein D5H75_09145 [Bailinhaonella thermotolerans]